MAARVRRLVHDEETRTRIKVGQIVNRLQSHVDGIVELSPTQVRAAEILLRKVLPDLAMVEHSGEVEHSYVVRIPAPAAEPLSWQQKHAPPALIEAKAEKVRDG